MTFALRTRMTPDEALAWERRQGPRHESGGVRPVAMPPGAPDAGIEVPSPGGGA